MSINHQSAPEAILVEKRYSVATEGDALAIIAALDCLGMSQTRNRWPPRPRISRSCFMNL